MVSNFNMVRRWSLSLLAINAFLAFLLMGSEELDDWHHYDFWQPEEQRSQRAFSPVLPKEVQQVIPVENWPDLRIKAFNGLNLPMSNLLGSYSHPLSIVSNSILGPSLLRVCRRLSVKSRVVILDAVLLFGVCLQWWLVGLWLERPVPMVQLLRAVVAGMTSIGTVATLAVFPRPIAFIALIGEVLTPAIALGWVLLIVTGTISLILTTKRALTRAS